MQSSLRQKPPAGEGVMVFFSISNHPPPKKDKQNPLMNWVVPTQKRPWCLFPFKKNNRLSDRTSNERKHVYKNQSPKGSGKPGPPIRVPSPFHSRVQWSLGENHSLQMILDSPPTFHGYWNRVKQKHLDKCDSLNFSLEVPAIGTVNFHQLGTLKTQQSSCL